MAVLPSARSAFARPAHLPWLAAAAALVAITVVVPGAFSRADESRDTPTAAAVSDATSLAAPDLAGLAIAVNAAQGRSVALDAWRYRVQSHAAAASFLAATQELVQLTALIPAPVEETTEEAPATTELVAEVSQAAVVQVASETERAPVPEQPAPAVPTDAPATAGAPAAPQPVLAPVQAPAAPPGPVERWAAAGIIIETQGQALDDVSLANVNAALSALPAHVLANLGNPVLGPIHILVNTEGRVLSGDQPYGGPANFFSTNEGKNELVLYPQQSVFTIVHELGHAYNLRNIAAGRYAMVLLDSEMRSFLAATGWQINSSESQIRKAVDHMHVSYSYGGSFHWPRMSNDDPLEDFANSFAMYFLDAGSLYQYSPERYAWMAGTFQ